MKHWGFGVQPNASRAPDIPVLMLKSRKAFPPARQPLHHTGLHEEIMMYGWPWGALCSSIGLPGRRITETLLPLFQ